MRLLVVSLIFPYPINSGGAIAVWSKLMPITFAQARARLTGTLRMTSLAGTMATRPFATQSFLG